LSFAFQAGERAGRAAPGLATPVQDAALKLFIRQPLTESGAGQQALIASVLARIERHNGAPRDFHYLTGHQAESADTFRASFEAESGQPFTPQNFREWRLGRLAQADAFINIRAGMSESSAFELSYHVFRGACTPVLFLVWKHAPIKTTLLKDLQDLCDVTYLEFEHAEDLDAGLGEFFHRRQRLRAAA
jgi:carbamoyl-phosphate synthase large subunit